MAKNNKVTKIRDPERAAEIQSYLKREKTWKAADPDVYGVRERIREKLLDRGVSRQKTWEWLGRNVEDIGIMNETRRRAGMDPVHGLGVLPYALGKADVALGMTGIPAATKTFGSAILPQVATMADLSLISGDIVHGMRSWPGDVPKDWRYFVGPAMSPLMGLGMGSIVTNLARRALPPGAAKTATTAGTPTYESFTDRPYTRRQVMKGMGYAGATAVVGPRIGTKLTTTTATATSYTAPGGAVITAGKVPPSMLGSNVTGVPLHQFGQKFTPSGRVKLPTGKYGLPTAEKTVQPAYIGSWEASSFQPRLAGASWAKDWRIRDSHALAEGPSSILNPKGQFLNRLKEQLEVTTQSTTEYSPFWGDAVDYKFMGPALDLPAPKGSINARFNRNIMMNTPKLYQTQQEVNLIWRLDEAMAGSKPFFVKYGLQPNDITQMNSMTQKQQKIGFSGEEGRVAGGYRDVTKQVFEQKPVADNPFNSEVWVDIAEWSKGNYVERTTQQFRDEWLKSQGLLGSGETRITGPNFYKISNSRIAEWHPDPGARLSTKSNVDKNPNVHSEKTRIPEFPPQIGKGNAYETTPKYMNPTTLWNHFLDTADPRILTEKYAAGQGIMYEKAWLKMGGDKQVNKAIADVKNKQGLVLVNETRVNLNNPTGASFTQKWLKERGIDLNKVDIKETSGIASSKYTGQKIRVGKNKETKAFIDLAYIHQGQKGPKQKIGTYEYDRSNLFADDLWLFLNELKAATQGPTWGIKQEFLYNGVPIVRYKTLREQPQFRLGNRGWREEVPIKGWGDKSDTRTTTRGYEWGGDALPPQNKGGIFLDSKDRLIGKEGVGRLSSTSPNWQERVLGGEDWMILMPNMQGYEKMGVKSSALTETKQFEKLMYSLSATAKKK